MREVGHSSPPPYDAAPKIPPPGPPAPPRAGTASIRPRLVLQEEPYGCGIACVAMIAGKSYAEIRSLLGWWNPTTDGMDHYVIWEVLSHLGFACRHAWWWNHRKYRADEPWPASTAPAHIIAVPAPTGGHWIVWLADGTVLDPMKEAPQRLEDYPSPTQVIACIGG